MVGRPEKKVRIGVIGGGFGQRVHVPAFRSDVRCEVAAVCASTQARAQEFAARLGILKAYGDWHQLVEDPEIDAISIATPPAQHGTIAVAAFAHRKHVFCEKPLAATLEAASSMLAAAAEAGTANMVDFEFPEIDQWRKAREVLRAGGIGDLRHIHVAWYVETYANRFGVASWKTSAERGGGTLYGFVSHIFYYLEWLVGPIHKLAARLFHSGQGETRGDSLAVLDLQLTLGVPAVIVASTNAFLGSGHRIAIYGDEGTLVLENAASDYVKGFRLLLGTRATNALETISAVEHQGGTADDGRVDVVARLVARFVDWVQTGSPSAPGFRDGYRVQVLLEAARRAHMEASWVDVSP